MSTNSPSDAVARLREWVRNYQGEHNSDVIDWAVDIETGESLGPELKLGDRRSVMDQLAELKAFKDQFPDERLTQARKDGYDEGVRHVEQQFNRDFRDLLGRMGLGHINPPFDGTIAAAMGFRLGELLKKERQDGATGEIERRAKEYRDAVSDPNNAWMPVMADAYLHIAGEWEKEAAAIRAGNRCPHCGGVMTDPAHAGECPFKKES